MGFNFIKVFFSWQVFISITFAFIFNIIIIAETANSYGFVRISFLLFKRVIISLIILSFIASFSFFSLKKFLMFLIILSSSDCFVFLFIWFLSTSICSFYTIWFTIILGFMTHNLIFNPPTMFSETREYSQLTNYTNHTTCFFLLC